MSIIAKIAETKRQLRVLVKTTRLKVQLCQNSSTQLQRTVQRSWCAILQCKWAACLWCVCHTNNLSNGWVGQCQRGTFNSTVHFTIELHTYALNTGWVGGKRKAANCSSSSRPFLEPKKQTATGEALNMSSYYC